MDYNRQNQYTQYQGDTQNQQYPQKEKYSGVWNGNEIRFNRSVRGYRLTDAECEALLRGELIDLHLTSRAGKPYNCCGRLADMEYNGHAYVGVEILFIPSQWGGHTFTLQEKKMLADGGEVIVQDCVSKRTGRRYQAVLHFVEDGGQKKIVPDFSR